MLARRLASDAEPGRALAEYETIRRPRTEAVLTLSRRVDKAAQLTNPRGWRFTDALFRRMPERPQRRQLEALVRYGLDPP